MATPIETTTRQDTVTVVFNGRVISAKYQPHQAAQALLAHVFAEFGITTGREELGLYAPAGEVTPGASVAERGVRPGDQLILRPRIVRGG
jgi:hypothetical protein